MHGTSLLSTPGQFGPELLPSVNNDLALVIFCEKYNKILQKYRLRRCLSTLIE